MTTGGATMIERQRIYIAGPITQGDLAKNVRQAEEAYFALAKAGFAPLCPHWSVYSASGPLPGLDGGVWAHGAAAGRELTHSDWLAVDLPWLAAADAVLRLPGPSFGADVEVSLARRLGMPVFTSVEQVIAWGEVADER